MGFSPHAQLKLSIGVVYGNVYIRRVRSVLQKMICVFAVGVGGWLHATPAEMTPGQYQAIPERNVFGLRPPPAQAAPTNPPAALPKITLTGITTILGNKRALMKVLPAGLKPAEANKEQSLILTEGQREGEVEVLQIDERVGSVRVNNSGTVMTLTFEKDGAKLPATPAPAAVPSAPNALPGVTAPNPYAPAYSGRKTPARGVRTPGFGTAALNPAAAVSAPAGGIPTPTGLPTTPGQNPPLADQQLSAEEQAIVNAFRQQENVNNPNSLPQPSTPGTQNAVQSPVQGVPVQSLLPGGGTVPGTPRVLVPQ